MKFCSKCAGLMTNVEEKGKKYLKCSKCGHKEEMKKEKMVLKEEIIEDSSKKLIVFKKGEELEQFPTTKITCPKCMNDEAYWWIQQTRSSDEPPTIFYKCKKCSYTWRVYG
ncbi:MAG: transcription factor S [Candidatus Aenigmarchaeota archaeon]|nr:transcription factor S [Candidatus Aenigmarchaeota archaeon]MDW8160386.1 transcription factor S [Candidatus Aenigmarchaeota archaeon]